MQRIVYGALAGLSATMAMTAVMRRLYFGLEARDRYPLPPREIVERTIPAGSERQAQTITLLAHFGYGALTGALFALLPRHRAGGVPLGASYGVSVWALSYLGWIPALGILAPATSHPSRRNLLMLAAHLVWGAALDLGLQELRRSSREVFSGGPLRDAPQQIAPHQIASTAKEQP